MLQEEASRVSDQTTKETVSHLQRQFALLKSNYPNFLQE